MYFLLVIKSLMRAQILLLMMIVNTFSLSFKHAHEVLLYLKENKIVPDNPVILEAGAHYGEDTKRMQSVWPAATFYLFEPLPSSFAKLIEDTADMPRVTCYPFALNNYQGITNFYFNPGNDGASSIGFPVEFNEQEFIKDPLQVPCITLDKWAADYNVGHVDFMWFDMEGKELDVLSTGTSVLQHVKAIYTEISFVPVRQNSGLYVDLRKFLEMNGFKEVWKGADEGRYADALFIRQ